MLNLLVRVAACAALLFALSAVASAQAAFQDAEGKSSVFIQDKDGFASINVSDKRIDIGYLFDRGERGWFYGFDVSGKAAGKFATLFSGGTPAPEGAFNFRVGKRFLGSEAFSKITDRCIGEYRTAAQQAGRQFGAADEITARARCLQEDPAFARRLTVDWLTFQTGYKRARYKLLNESGAFADQVRKQSFDGYNVTLGYNALITLAKLASIREARQQLKMRRDQGEALTNVPDGPPQGSIIFGASIGVERRNNVDDLKEIEVEDQTFTSVGGTTQRRAVSRQQVLSGIYKEFTAVPLNTDVVWHPASLAGRIAFDAFTRSNLGDVNREFVPGVGVFITEKGAPTKVVGGISFSFKDGKARIGLVGGFHF
jgi:hypothetical protein